MQVSKTPDKQASLSVIANTRIQSSTYNFFIRKFGLEQDEQLIETFSCALADNILLQGKLFISNKRLSFHSYFNRITLFFGETKMNIPMKDVKKLEKRYNALIFNNSLAIITEKGEIFFTSFVYRDRAYNCITGILKENYTVETPENFGPGLDGRFTPITEEENGISTKKKPESQEFTPWEGLQSDEELIIKPEPDQQKELEKEFIKGIESRLIKISAITPKDEEFKTQTMDFVLSEKCDLIDIFKIVFSNEEITKDGKKFGSFWEYLRVAIGGDTNFLITEWSPTPPEYFSKGLGSSKQLLDAPLYCEREATFIHPVNSGGIPFMPKTCPVKEIHKIYWESNDRFFVDLEVRTSKIAYSDTFFLKIRYRFSRNPEGRVQFAWRLAVIFEKDTILKKTIEKQACSESKQQTQEVIFPAIDKAIKEAIKNEDYIKKKRISASEAYELKEITPNISDLGVMNKEEELILRKEISHIGIEHIANIQSKLDLVDIALKDFSRQNLELRRKLQTMYNIQIVTIIVIAAILFGVWILVPRNIQFSTLHN